MGERKEKLLAEARKEGHAILEEMRKAAKEEEKEILAKAHEEAEAFIEKGRKDAERLKEELMKDVRRQTVVLASAMAKKLLAQALTNDDKHKILEKHLKELESLRE